MKPFIRWIGNKSKYVDTLHSHMPTSFNTYIEPFVGSGAFFLHIQPTKWIINDINKDLVNVWKNIRTNPEDIIITSQLFAKRFLALDKKGQTLLCRNLTKDLSLLPYNFKRNAIFLLMNYCAFMGHILRNGKYYFSGLELNIYRSTTPYFLSEKHYENIRKVSFFLSSSNGKIYNKDYKDILDKAKVNDFVFLDPPYIEDHSYRFNYNVDENLNDTFLQELLGQLYKLDARKVKWMMTQPDTQYVRNVFKKYNMIPFKVFRGFTNTEKYELLIKNY